MCLSDWFLSGIKHLLDVRFYRIPLMFIILIISYLT
ncbi:hypothetical protein SP99_04577 [Enterobacter sp. BIDMC92]|nr:hypothetical protein SP99_04577 [Enterobacter sp. BIDMC92]